MLRTPLLFGFILGFASVVSVPSAFAADKFASPIAISGQNTPTATHDMRYIWASLSPQQRSIVDLMAADFFESSMSLAQRQRIAEQTARQYVSAQPSEKNVLRSSRRQTFRELSPGQSVKVRDMKEPAYFHLNEDQKQPFRRHAIETLDLEIKSSQLKTTKDDSV